MTSIRNKKLDESLKYSDFDRNEFPKNSFAGQWKNKKNQQIMKRRKDAYDVYNSDCIVDPGFEGNIDPKIVVFNEHFNRELRAKHNTQNIYGINFHGELPLFVNQSKEKFENYLLSSKLLNDLFQSNNIKPRNDMCKKLAQTFVFEIYNAINLFDNRRKSQKMNQSIQISKDFDEKYADIIYNNVIIKVEKLFNNFYFEKGLEEDVFSKRLELPEREDLFPQINLRIRKPSYKQKNEKFQLQHKKTPFIDQQYEGFGNPEFKIYNF